MGRNRWVENRESGLVVIHDQTDEERRELSRKRRQDNKAMKEIHGKVRKRRKHGR